MLRRWNGSRGPRTRSPTTGGRVEPAFGQGGQYRGNLRQCVVDQAGRDGDYVAAVPVGFHGRDAGAGHLEEAAQVHPTKAAIIDGWFHTGDMATRDDDGFYFIVDRMKDMIIRGDAFEDSHPV